MTILMLSNKTSSSISKLLLLLDKIKMKHYLIWKVFQNKKLPGLVFKLKLVFYVELYGVQSEFRDLIWVLLKEHTM